MEELSKYVFFLAIYHIAFWWKFYTTDRLCTSEVASNFFPQWLWQGRHPFKFRDAIYYRYPACIPFLSTFYPISRLLGLIAPLVSRNIAFKMYTILILVHSLIGSLGAFIVFSHWVSPLPALLGSLTIAYGAYMVKPQTPCAMFTMAWIPWMLIPGLGWLGLGLAILGGYWPILLVAMPLTLLNPECLWGVLLGLPQIIPFLWYWPRSIRAKQTLDAKWGRMPLKRLLVNLRLPENGIHYPEYAFGVGVCLWLWLLNPGYWWLLVVMGFIGARGWFVIARIPARWLYLLSFGLVGASLGPLEASQSLLIPLLVGQGYLLWKNRDIYPSFPFSQWWRKPSEHYYHGSEWPNNTGYMNEDKKKAYHGGFALAENYHE